jgi:hypothetical protein
MDWSEFIAKLVQDHSGEVLILLLTCLMAVTLLSVLPFLLRHNHRKAEMRHQEHMKALEQGLPLPVEDDRARSAGRTALYVPIMVMISAGAVTCYLVSAHVVENLFAVALAVWVVAGVVSLVAITGGVALIGRLAQISARQEDEEEEESPEEEEQYTP